MSNATALFDDDCDTEPEDPIKGTISLLSMVLGLSVISNFVQMLFIMKNKSMIAALTSPPRQVQVDAARRRKKSPVLKHQEGATD